MAITALPAIPMPTFIGKREFPAQKIPDDAKIVGVYIKRATSVDPTIWESETSKVEVKLEISFDDGQTWEDGGGFTSSGGIKLIDLLTESRYSGVTFQLPPFNGKQRWLRGTITVDGDPVKTAVEVAVTDKWPSRSTPQVPR